MPAKGSHNGDPLGKQCWPDVTGEVAITRERVAGRFAYTTSTHTKVRVSFDGPTHLHVYGNQYANALSGTLDSAAEIAITGRIEYSIRYRGVTISGRVTAYGDEAVWRLREKLQRAGDLARVLALFPSVAQCTISLEATCAIASNA